MQLFKKTGCFILLLGYVQEIPELMMDEQGELMLTLTLRRIKINSDTLGRFVSEDNFSYRVQVSGESALRIRQFGFPGLYLWVEGDLENNDLVIAEKISFLDFPRYIKNENDCLEQSFDDLYYCEFFRLSFIEDMDVITMIH